MKVEKRFARGLQFITHYTYSHADGYDSNYYPIDHKIAWGPVDFNRNHVWVLNTVYELPFGKGKQFMGDASRAMDYVVGGWQLSNTTNWGSGLPWTPGFSSAAVNKTWVSAVRTGVSVHSIPESLGTLTRFNHNLTFYTPSSGHITNPANPPRPICPIRRKGISGNIQRNSFHGPRAFTSDLSIVKKFPVFERLNAQFRTDFFNLFNHPVYRSVQQRRNTTIDCHRHQRRQDHRPSVWLPDAADPVRTAVRFLEPTQETFSKRESSETPSFLCSNLWAVPFRVRL